MYSIYARNIIFYPVRFFFRSSVPSTSHISLYLILYRKWKLTARVSTQPSSPPALSSTYIYNRKHLWTGLKLLRAPLTPSSLPTIHTHAHIVDIFEHKILAQIYIFLTLFIIYIVPVYPHAYTFSSKSHRNLTRSLQYIHYIHYNINTYLAMYYNII